METKFIEASQGDAAGPANWGKFMLARFEPEEWAHRVTLPVADFVPGAEASRSLLVARGWSPRHVLFVDLETGEGTMLSPGGSAKADLEKHRVWVCPLAEPFLEWLYEQDLRDLQALPSYVQLPDAPFSMAGYRRHGVVPGRVARATVVEVRGEHECTWGYALYDERRSELLPGEPYPTREAAQAAVDEARRHDD